MLPWVPFRELACPRFPRPSPPPSLCLPSRPCPSCSSSVAPDTSQQGRNPDARSIRHTLDPVVPFSHRPLALYAALGLFRAAGRWMLRARGFRRHLAPCGSFWYWHRQGEGPRGGAGPIVLFHGIGSGLLPYSELISRASSGRVSLPAEAGGGISAGAVVAPSQRVDAPSARPREPNASGLSWSSLSVAAVGAGADGIVPTGRPRAERGILAIHPAGPFPLPDTPACPPRSRSNASSWSLPRYR